MFTGIIEAVSEVVRLERMGSEYRLTLKNRFGRELSEGDSISTDGVCLTVEKFNDDTVSFFVSRSTAEKTIASSYTPGTAVNLERAMPADGRFNGHIVQGHVDCCGKIAAARKIGLGCEISIEFSREFSDLVTARSSVTVNGVSLTASEVRGNTFTVSLIPETLEHTSFSKGLKQGDSVNLEFDIIGKYVANIVKRGTSDSEMTSLLGKL